MEKVVLAVLGSLDLIVFGSVFLGTLLFLLGSLYFKWWLFGRPPSLSPYSKQPLRPAADLSYQAKVNTLRYLFKLNEYYNPLFEFKRAAVCRETGRLFPEAVTWYGVIRVDWSFLNKRHPGKYVSWGSLTRDQQEAVRASHDSLEGFQTEFSSPEVLPRSIEAKFAFAKPGPLYVDIDTNTLLGWKAIPETQLEYLVVQKPVKYITISVH